ncbi:hypothetical protein DVA67_027035 [Solirubrobacter sp. CPCC 204708]|uniref:Clp R domain-containing protein n=1 Tax=Solirubrobacter deserti TaxID=2282478 RepID=A0ABT4RGK1_9ACTN|nr:Clp protease N-terminal domain-containing protein [Solirubrobacter deserti]MBE2319653.1 hypothetical protein [Solirubrobacter deserti]MDA0137608.1 hypothetical protein [Solirubrobacter deserti]
MAPYNPQKTLSLLERTLTAEPTASLRALTALRAELDVLERHLVARALQEGQTYTQIARPLGISRQAAHRRYRDLTSPPTLSEAARAALVRAREEAARHGSRSIDGEHLALALAQAGALQFDAEAARRSFPPPAMNAPSPAGLHPSLHARLIRNSGVLGLDHLVKATLEDDGARRLLEQFPDRGPVANGRGAGGGRLAESLH